MKRPMLYWVVLFILGEVLFRSIPVGCIGVIAVGMFVGIRYIRISYLQDNRCLCLLGVVFFILGAVCTAYMDKKLAICNIAAGENVTFKGFVKDVEEKKGENCYTVTVSQINEQLVKVCIIVETGQQIVPGSQVFGSGIVKAFSKSTNPGGFDEENYQYGRGNLLFLEKGSFTERKGMVVSVRKLLYDIRQSLKQVYDTLFSEVNASLAKAMVLGIRSELDSDIKQLYQRNGIAHLIAISGLHIAMLGGTIYHFLRKRMGSYPVAAAFGMVFILLYGIMAGLSGATLRAVVMLAMSMGADVSGRRYDIITSISVALLLMLLCNPYQVSQAGFLLSFGAVIGIAVVNPIWNLVFGETSSCLEGFRISVSVQMVLLPILLYYFYEIPVYGIFLNVIVVPLMSILLALLLFCGIMGIFFPQCTILPVKMADGIFFLYEKLCGLSEQLPFHTICTGRPDVMWIICYYGILAVFVLSVYKEKRKVQILSIVSLLLLLLFLYVPGNLKICMFDVGQGDGIYIRTPNHRHILIDGGSSSKQKVGTYVLKNGIKYYGGAVLDYVFVTHSDSDHYSGIEELLEEKTVSIHNFVLPAVTNPDEAYRELEQKATEQGCRIYYMKKGDVLKAGNVIFYCLNPEQKTYEDKNQGSIVLKMTYKSFDMLFTGDMDETTEKEMPGELMKGIEVLKVAHHGSTTSSSEMFLKNAAFHTALVSVGEKNRYGHPAKEVIERLETYCQRVYLTKDSGAITIDTDGEEYKISTFVR